VKLREERRFSGKALSTTVSRVADRWFVSVPIEVDIPEAVRESQAAVGIDLGVRTTATLSSGEKLTGPKALHVHLEKLQRLSRQHSRKKKGGNNRRKSAMRLARLRARICHIRQDWLHQTTTRLVKEFSVDGYIDIGAFDRPAKGKQYGDTLHRERVHIRQKNSTFTFVTAKLPDKAGIDPFALLIDRVPDHNTKSVDLVNSGAKRSSAAGSQ
jgi:transposase